MEDLFKTFGDIFRPTPIEEIEKICNDAGLKEKPKTFEEYISEERPTLHETYALACKIAVEWEISKFIFQHEGTYYLVEWKKKGTAFEYWSDPEEIEKL